MPKQRRSPPYIPPYTEGSIREGAFALVGPRTAILAARETGCWIYGVQTRREFEAGYRVRRAPVACKTLKELRVDLRRFHLPPIPK